MKIVRVLLADKKGLFRKGLAKLLESEPNSKIVGTCDAGFEAIETSAEHKPNVVLIDTGLCECSGSKIGKAISALT